MKVWDHEKHMINWSKAVLAVLLTGLQAKTEQWMSRELRPEGFSQFCSICSLIAVKNEKKFHWEELVYILTILTKSWGRETPKTQSLYRCRVSCLTGKRNNWLHFRCKVNLRSGIWASGSWQEAFFLQEPNMKWERGWSTEGLKSGLWWTCCFTPEVYPLFKYLPVVSGGFYRQMCTLR